mgnify:FL=1
MIFIPSSQYVRIEIQNEIGNLPPTFSFLQNRRLYAFQVDLLKQYWKDERIILSLPEFFEIPEVDMQRLENLKVDVFRDSPKNKLGKHLHNFISEYKPNSIKILHGDTFFNALPLKKDTVVIGKPIESADWYMSKTSKEKDYVWAGFFNISNAQLFHQSLIDYDFSFEKSIEEMFRKLSMKDSKTEHWFDFGHIEGFHKSRQRYTTERSFNNLKVNKYEVIKSSKNKEKIKNEFNWFNSLPSHLRKFSPNVYDLVEESSSFSYKMNYIYGFSLSELMLFSRLNKKQWEMIVIEINLILMDQQKYLPNNSYELSESFIEEILESKNKGRIRKIYESGFIKEESAIFLNDQDLGTLNEIVIFLNDLISKNEAIPSFIHGDLCFSNIIYKARGNTLKFLDPRGIASGEIPIGDQRYDLAKLSHSIFWGYDRVISGEALFKKSGNCFNKSNKVFINDNQEIIKDLIKSNNELKILLREDIQALTSLLFISMIPLHADSIERQESLLGIGLDIFSKLKFGEK